MDVATRASLRRSVPRSSAAGRVNPAPLSVPPSRVTALIPQGKHFVAAFMLSVFTEALPGSVRGPGPNLEPFFFCFHRQRTGSPTGKVVPEWHQVAALITTSHPCPAMWAFPDAQEVLQPHPTFIPTDEGGILAELFGCRVGVLHREQRGGGKPPPTGGWKRERYFVFGGLTDKRKHVEWQKVTEAVDSLCSELQTLDRIGKRVV